MRRILRQIFLQNKLTTGLLLLLSILSLILLAYVFYIHEVSVRDNVASTVSVKWQRLQKEGNRIKYKLSKDDHVALVLTCRNKKFTINTLRAMSIVRLSIDGEESNLSSIGINGHLYYVPVINENPNPTEEQIRFLKALSKADIVTFRHNKVNYVWPTKNQTELSYCVDLP